MNPTITKYVDVFFGSDGEEQEGTGYETLNDAISNMWDDENWQAWDDENLPLAATSNHVVGNYIDQGHWNVFKLKHCLKIRSRKIYFRKFADLKHFEATLDTYEEREITDGTV